jgi:hypothetical protein
MEHRRTEKKQENNRLNLRSNSASLYERCPVERCPDGWERNEESIKFHAVVERYYFRRTRPSFSLAPALSHSARERWATNGLLRKSIDDILEADFWARTNFG